MCRNVGFKLETIYDKMKCIEYDVKDVCIGAGVLGVAYGVVLWERRVWLVETNNAIIFKCPVHTAQ